MGRSTHSEHLQRVKCANAMRVAGLTQQEIAEAYDVSQQAVSQWLAADTPAAEEIRAIGRLGMAALIASMEPQDDPEKEMRIYAHAARVPNAPDEHIIKLINEQLDGRILEEVSDERINELIEARMQERGLNPTP